MDTESNASIPAAPGFRVSDISSRLWSILRTLSRNDLPHEPQLEYRLIADVGLDSFSFVELLLTLEEQFGIDIGETAFFGQEFKTVKELLAYLSQQP